MTKPDFEQAIHIAKIIITSKHSLPSNLDTSTFFGLSAKRAANCDRTTEEGYFEFRAENYGAEMFLQRPDQLLAEAAVNPLCFAALCRGAANALETNTPLPIEITEWLSGYLRGERTQPKKLRGHPINDARPLKIYIAVQYLVQLGMTSTRNDQSKHGCRESACDAVAEALVELRMKVRSYKRVKEIYLKERSDGGQCVIVTPEIAEQF